MLTVKENFFETLKRGGKPDRLVNQWEPFALVPDPVLLYTLNRERGKNVRDRWGTMVVWPEDQCAAMPHVTEDDKVVPDITCWREYAKAPDILTHCSDGWEPWLEMAREQREKGLLVMPIMITGVFEQLHFLMGFEDTLVNFLVEPESMHELCEYVGDYRCTYAKMLIEKLKPDVVLSHDDWGTKRSLFMSPEIWREFIKPQYARIYKLFKDAGIIVMHHSDSFLEPIVEDMIELGIDIWQGALPENDLVRLQKEIDGRMVLMGGIDVSKIDFPDSTEEQIRAETRHVCETYGVGGNFIVAATYGGPEDVIYPHVKPIITSEIDAFNAQRTGR